MIGAKRFMGGYQHQIHRSIITRHARTGKWGQAHGLSTANSLLIGRTIQTHFSGYMESLDVERRFLVPQLLKMFGITVALTLP
jgi:hypothetical protein